MKNLMFICFMLSYFTLAQNTEVYQVEYVKNGNQMLGVGFDIDLCSESAIKSSWKDWVKGRNGKVSVVKDLIGNSQASEVQFNRQSFNVIFDVLKKEGSDSLTLVNIFQYPNGGFINQADNPNLYEELKSTIVDFAYETKKACVRNSLEDAHKYQGKLNDELVSLQRKKGREEKNILSYHNDILKWENDNRTLTESISTLTTQINDTLPGKKLDKLIKKKERAESTLVKNEGKIIDAKNEIVESEEDVKQLTLSIEQKNAEIAKQRELVDTIKEKLSRITP